MNSRLADAGFDLRKWKSNDSRFENYINSMTCTNSTDDVNLDNPSLILNKISSVNCSSTKILGLNWDTTSNKFIFNFKDILSTAVNLSDTKRNILKISSKFFDLLGFIIPITLPAKVLYKDICLEKYTWESEIRCNYIQKRRMRYLNELNTLSKDSINRHVLCCDCRIVDIHGFCDSAGKVYCAIVFAKVSCRHDVSVKFWVWKSRLAPMKKLTIPSLELLAYCCQNL